MKNNNKEQQIINERKEAIKKICKYLETIDTGNDIRSVMEDNQLSHQFLAELIRCDRSNIAHIFKRKNSIDVVQLILISVALEYNFFEKICCILKMEKEEKIPDIASIEFTTKMVKIIPSTNPESVMVFRRHDT